MKYFCLTGAWHTVIAVDPNGNIETDYKHLIQAPVTGMKRNPWLPGCPCVDSFNNIYIHVVDGQKDRIIVISHVDGFTSEYSTS